MLGVTLDLDNLIESSVTVRNKTSKIEGMTATIREVLDRGSMTARLAASVKGKELPLSASLPEALMWSLDVLGSSIGKAIPLRQQEYQVVEGQDSEACSMGGVAFFPDKQPERLILSKSAMHSGRCPEG
eukprot:4966190-Amphidinium_carterae.1